MLGWIMASRGAIPINRGHRASAVQVRKYGQQSTLHARSGAPSCQRRSTHQTDRYNNANLERRWFERDDKKPSSVNLGLIQLFQRGRRSETIHGRAPARLK